MINEKFWNRELHLFEIPKFQCPNCTKGLLISTVEKTIKQHTEQSIRAYELTGEPEFLEGQFITIISCNNPDCKEITSMAGKTKIVQFGWDNGLDPDTHEELHSPGPKYETIYEVNYLNPAINLIEVPKNTPTDITEVIHESFTLFWIDEGACGNKVRSTVENLLDSQKVKKYVTNKKGKRQRLKLHQRLESFKDKEPEIANYLMALKWVGNEGSHSKSNLNRKKVNCCL